MRKFKFKLRSLLTMKHAAEKQVQRELADIQAAEQRRQQELAATGEKIVEWSRYYNRVLQRGVQSVELESIDYHLQRLYRFREQTIIGLEVLQRKKEDLIQQYRHIKREVKTLDHLQEQRFAEYCATLRAEEQKEADELATIRFVRERVPA